MKIYSTMSREKEDLKTLFKDKIKLFVCGPTVYDDAHIGHGSNRPGPAAPRECRFPRCGRRG